MMTMVVMVVVLYHFMVMMMVFLNNNYLGLRRCIVNRRRRLVGHLVRQLLVLVGTIVRLASVGHVTWVSVHLL